MQRCGLRDRFAFCLRWALVLRALSPLLSSAADPEQVDFLREAGRVVIQVAGRPVATYVYDDPKIHRPYFANVSAPGGIQVTRNHPPIAGTDIDDHADFHPGIWMAFGDLSGTDNWRLKVPVQHVRFDREPQGGPGKGSFAVINHYRGEGEDPQVVCEELCRFTFFIRPSGYLLVWDSTFSSDREFFFGDQEEMGLGIRVATPIRVAGAKDGVPAGNGAILDAAGRKNADQIWGTSSEWCDYQGVLQDRRVGIALFCHPDNFRPSRFHARDYGLLVANPFGRKAFHQGEASRILIPAGQSFRLRYAVLLHAGAVDSSLDLASAYRDFVRLADRTQGINVLWQRGPLTGQVTVRGGSLEGSDQFDLPDRANVKLPLTVEGSGIDYGDQATLITLDTNREDFSFLLSNVSRECPIWVPAYGVAVTTDQDERDYGQVTNAIRSQGLRTKLEQIDEAPEASFAKAVEQTRDLSVQTWLGLSRDIRLFAVGERLDWIQPRLHGHEVTLAEADQQPVRYEFLMGRGWGVRDEIVRHLEDDVLPILHGALTDEDIRYELIAFTSLEASPLTLQTLRGTHFLVADGFGYGHMFTPQQQQQHDQLRAQELEQPEETVLYMRVSATNTTSAPAYAFWKNIWPSRSSIGWSLDEKRGFSTYANGRVFAVSTLNGQPLTRGELALLLPPGKTATLDLYVPHRPITVQRAEKLAAQDFEKRHAEARAFWQQKLARAARIRLPETRIQNMLRAGLLHLDLVTYGREPDDTLTATIGVYSAIGSESSPIIQFLDSMGWHSEAQRALTYFLDKQHDDGFMQNFGGYMLETGAVLWSLGEHYRYTRDDAWLAEIKPKVVKACEYLRNWRARNMRPELQGRGYGMLDGKTADPEDPFHSFMLNGYAYLGLARTAEMLRAIDPNEAQRWQTEAEHLRRDIRASLTAATARAPVVPLRDGSWCPSVAPWPEYRGPLVLFTDGGNWYTHGAMVARDSLLGPLYLVFQEVVEPHEPAADYLLQFHNDLMTRQNVAFSQPYYSRHPIVHLRRGEVKPFLQAYYHTLASLADRQTYTFWEHYFGASPHKTHEEGWFLMDTRWMLYQEHGDQLSLLPGIPRAWLEDGNRIELDRVATYFGPLSLRAVSRVNDGRIEVDVRSDSARKPAAVEIRLPHPAGRQARAVDGANYDAARESVRVESFTGQAHVVLHF